MPNNTLYYGDNLDILRRYVADGSPESPPHLAVTEHLSPNIRPGTGVP